MGSIVWLVIVGNGFLSASASSPTADLVVGFGHESDLVLVDSPEAPPVPGGAFAELRALMLDTRRFGDDGRLRFGLRANSRSFLGNADRRVLGGGPFGELILPFGHGWHTSFRAVAGGFDDDVRPELRRWHAGVDARLGHTWSRCMLETGIALGGSRMPDYPVVDDDGDAVALTDRSAAWIAAATADLGRSAWLRLDAELRTLDAVDPWFDARIRSAGLAFWFPVGPAGRVALGAGVQHRAYDHRPDGAVDDLWRHAGLTLIRDLGRTWRLEGSVGLGRYSGLGDDTTDTRHCALSLGRSFGSGPPETPAPIPPPIRAGDPAPFRCYAPAASSVSLVGDFNDWDPEADLMIPSPDGWWRLERALPAGAWPYAYLVDGTPTPPADTDILVDDGFGGTNGVIVVRPVVTSSTDGRLISERPADEPSSDRNAEQER